MSYCYNCFRDCSALGPCPHCGYDPSTSTGQLPHALPCGTILAGQFITGRVLGQGGFGITYLAWDNKAGERVALKEFLPDIMAGRPGGSLQVTAYSGDRGQQFQYGLERFLDEAKTLAKFIGNPNIAGVRSYFEENGTAYFTMDYIEGISFKAYLRNHGGHIGWEETARILLPVMDALSIVHQEGLIHRDVTPDNIYIESGGGIKLLDFGAARYSLGDRSKSLDVVLKAGYAPKEQYTRRGKQGSYTDVYSLGACFYMAITGYLPPESLDRMEEDDLVPPSTRGIKLPPELEDAILCSLEVQPADRYQTMADFRAAVDAVLTRTDTEPQLEEERELIPEPEPIPVPEPEPIPELLPNVEDGVQKTEEDEQREISSPSFWGRLKAMSKTTKGGIAACICCVVLAGVLAAGAFSREPSSFTEDSLSGPGYGTPSHRDESGNSSQTEEPYTMPKQFPENEKKTEPPEENDGSGEGREDDATADVEKPAQLPKEEEPESPAESNSNDTVDTVSPVVEPQEEKKTPDAAPRQEEDKRPTSEPAPSQPQPTVTHEETPNHVTSQEYKITVRYLKPTSGSSLASRSKSARCGLAAVQNRVLLLNARKAELEMKVGDLMGVETGRQELSGTYTGGWSDGKPNGQGTFISNEQTLYGGTWEGTWKDGAITHGVCTYANGDCYEGDLVSGCPNGYGKMVYKNGERYSGSWANGLKHGEGTLTRADGSSESKSWYYDRDAEEIEQAKAELAALEAELQEVDKVISDNIEGSFNYFS